LPSRTSFDYDAVGYSGQTLGPALTRKVLTNDIFISVSPCSNPEMSLDEALANYGKISFNRFELFTSWVKSAVDPATDPNAYLAMAQAHGFQFSSIHLPQMRDQSELP